MKNRKNLIITLMVVAIIMIIGATYAFFTYTRTGNQNSQLIAGEIYLHYNEGTNALSLSNILPESDSVARSKSNNVLTFTIDGKNTTTNKDIYYEIVLSDGSNQGTKTRLKDSHLKFDLVETKTQNNVTTTNTVLEGVSYNELNNTKIWVNTVPSNTTSEIVYTYQLRMWISDEVLISDTELSADYTTTVFANSFASVRVSVNGDFEEKVADDYIMNVYGKPLYDVVETSLASYLLADDGDARIISGSNEQLTNNYVWYSGKLWRIVALNNDGSIKLVTQDNITIITWGANTTYEGSWMYQWLNEDFRDTLYNYENLLVTNYQWNATQTSASTKPANTTMVEGTVGLLNYYEYVQSYSNLGTDSTAYGAGYLNNGYYWWPITPSSSSRVRSVYESGSAGSNDPSLYSNGARPSINLKSNIQIRGGEGTKTNPYTIVGDISEPDDNELISERVSGEYVTFDNELYRIVSIDNNITKITKVDYIRNSSNTVVTKKLSSTYLYGASGNTKNDNYWDYYLNNTWYNSISTNYKNMLVSGTWYLGTVSNSTTSVSNNYKNAICATSNTTETTKLCTRTSAVYNGYVGLGRIGEMFTSQIGEGYIPSMTIWTITPYSSSGVWRVYNSGNASGNSNYSNPSLYGNGACPSVNLKSTIKITGGLGTKESPFVISE